MNIKDIINNKLHKEDYYISIYQDYIYIYKYKELLFFNNNNIYLSFINFNLKIIGNNLIIIKSIDSELLIKGEIIKIEKDNE